MTIMTAEAPGHARTAAAVPRPASGIVLEPGRLQQWMDLLPMSRTEVSDRITELGLLPMRHAGKNAPKHEAVPDPARGHCTVCGRDVASGLSADAVAKIANGTRKPKARSLRAICGALGLRPEDLLPGAPAPDPDAEAKRRVKEFNDGMIEFADAIGRPELYQYTAPDGRIRRKYRPELRRMYAQFLADEQAGAVPLAS